MARINKEDIDRMYDYGLYVPTRTVYIGSEQDDYDNGESGTDAIMAQKAIKALHILDTTEAPITIIMNNPGGSYYHGMAVYDAIKACKSHVAIKVFGEAMSAGAIILQAADERIISPHARVMIHIGTMGWDDHSINFARWAKEDKRCKEEMEQIFLKRIQEKNPKIKLKQVRDMLKFDTILDSAETVDLGLADKILGKE